MNKKFHPGFTLIEVMIVAAIVAILASLAMSYYGDNVISARRTDGRSALLNNAARLEKCKATYGSYNHGNCPALVNSADGYYNITENVATTATTFNLVATPTGSQASDADCATIILDNLGQQTGTGANWATECW